MNFYKKFIKTFNRITTLFNDFLKNVKNDKKWKKIVFDLIVKKTFETLKKCFKYVSLLKYLNQLFKIIIETDVSKFVIFVILFQLNKKIKQWHFVAFLSKKMTSAKRNYEKKNVNNCKNLQTIKHYLKNTVYQIWIITNYYNLRIFFKNKTLSKKKIR